MQGAKHQVTGLGGFQGCGEGLLVADFADQDHIRVFAQGSTKGLIEHLGVLAHFPLANQGLLAVVHKLHRILDRQDVAGHGAVDVVDHGGQGGAFA